MSLVRPAWWCLWRHLHRQSACRRWHCRVSRQTLIQYVIHYEWDWHNEWTMQLPTYMRYCCDTINADSYHGNHIFRDTTFECNSRSVLFVHWEPYVWLRRVLKFRAVTISARAAFTVRAKSKQPRQLICSLLKFKFFIILFYHCGRDR